MSDSTNDNSGEKKPRPLEKFSEEEKKEIIDKMKNFLASEEDEKVILYAALLKGLL
jgi:hypothetical protein